MQDFKNTKKVAKLKFGDGVVLPMSFVKWRAIGEYMGWFDRIDRKGRYAPDFIGFFNHQTSMACGAEVSLSDRNGFHYMIEMWSWADMGKIWGFKYKKLGRI